MARDFEETFKREIYFPPPLSLYKYVPANVEQNRDVLPLYRSNLDFIPIKSTIFFLIRRATTGTRLLSIERRKARRNEQKKKYEYIQNPHYNGRSYPSLFRSTISVSGVL